MYKSYSVFFDRIANCGIFGLTISSLNLPLSSTSTISYRNSRLVVGENDLKWVADKKNIAIFQTVQ